MSPEVVVSVVIPCRDHLGPLVTALETLVPDSTPEVEVVVVDDGSRRPVAGAITPTGMRCPVRVVRLEQSSGPCVARNVGAGAARGRHLVFLDADDRPRPGWLRLWLDVAARDVALGSCGVAVEHLSEGSVEVVRPRPLGPLYRDLRACFFPGAYLVERGLFLGVGGFDPRVTYGEHHELGLRLAHVPVDQWSTDAVLLDKKHDRSPDRVTAYARSQAESVTYMLRKHEGPFAADRRARADYLAIGGVASYRCGRRWPAFRLLLTSALLRPDARSILRVVAAGLPWVGRRAWAA